MNFIHEHLFGIYIDVSCLIPVRIISTLGSFDVAHKASRDLPPPPGSHPLRIGRDLLADGQTQSKNASEGK